MKKKHTLYIFTFILIFIPIIIIHIINKNNNDIFSCEGDYLKKSKHFDFSGVLRFDFLSKKNGIVIFSGKLIDKSSNESSIITSKVSFEYKKVKNQYILTSSKIIDNKSERNIDPYNLDFLLPDFYKEPNKELQLGIYKFNNNGYVFYNIITPILYCYKKIP